MSTSLSFSSPTDTAYYLNYLSSFRGTLYLNARKAQGTPDTSSQGTHSNFGTPQKASEDSTRHRQEPESTHQRIKELEDKVFNLEVDRRAKEQVITLLKDQVKADREEFVQRLVMYSHRVGELETTVRQLEAPRTHRSSDALVQTATQTAEYATMNDDGERNTDLSDDSHEEHGVSPTRETNAHQRTRDSEDTPPMHHA